MKWRYISERERRHRSYDTSHDLAGPSAQARFNRSADRDAAIFFADDTERFNRTCTEAGEEAKDRGD
eukprot:2160101-Pleurochrysis_carterae.AAC.1